jgi:hypothetical protein
MKKILLAALLSVTLFSTLGNAQWGTHPWGRNPWGQNGAFGRGPWGSGSSSGPSVCSVLDDSDNIVKDDSGNGVCSL